MVTFLKAVEIRQARVRESKERLQSHGCQKEPAKCTCQRSFYQEQMLEFAKCFFCICADKHMIFHMYFVYMV